MIFVVSWSVFHLKYFNQNTIYGYETEDTFEFYTYDGMACVKCVVEKQDNQEANIMFIERYFRGFQNVISCLDIERDDKPKPNEESQMLSKEAIREDEGYDEEIEDGYDMPEVEEEKEDDL